MQNQFLTVISSKTVYINEGWGELELELRLGEKWGWGEVGMELGLGTNAIQVGIRVEES